MSVVDEEARPAAAAARGAHGVAQRARAAASSEVAGSAAPSAHVALAVAVRRVVEAVRSGCSRARLLESAAAPIGSVVTEAQRVVARATAPASITATDAGRPVVLVVVASVEAVLVPRPDAARASALASPA